MEDGGSRKQSRRTGFFKFTHGFVARTPVTRCLTYTDAVMGIAPSVSISTADFCIAFQNAARGAAIEIVSMAKDALSLHYLGPAVIRAGNQAARGLERAGSLHSFSHPISRGPVGSRETTGVGRLSLCGRRANCVLAPGCSGIFCFAPDEPEARLRTGI